jgi:general secretion pathway protein G
MQRTGFTMIELIFVIVILGIISAIAIPKISATRDDSEYVKIINNTKQLIKDTQNYNFAKGTLTDSWTEITNVVDNERFVIDPINSHKLTIKVDGFDCLNFDKNPAGSNTLVMNSNIIGPWNPPLCAEILDFFGVIVKDQSYPINLATNLNP